MVNKLSTLEKLKPLPFEEKKRQIKQNIVINNIEKALNAKFSVEKKIKLDEAKSIENLILEENKIHKHMIEKEALEIQKEINSWLWLVLKVNWNIWGSMSMIELPILKDKNMYEAWSLIVHPDYRKKWLAKILSHDIFDHNKNKAIYSITEVPWVMHIYNEILKLHQFTKFEVHPEILTKIEEVWELLPTDIIYWNDEFKDLNDELIYKTFTGWFNDL